MEHFGGGARSVQGYAAAQRLKQAINHALRRL